MFLVLSSAIFIGCNKSYDHTINVCSNRLFVERFKHRFIDVSYYYLTDSSSFRVFVGKFDNEHGGFSFGCMSDSVEVSEHYEDSVITFRKYSFKDLQKKSSLDFPTHLK